MKTHTTHSGPCDDEVAREFAGRNIGNDCKKERGEKETDFDSVDSEILVKASREKGDVKEMKKGIIEEKKK